MDFGRPSDLGELDALDLSLPADDPATAPALELFRLPGEAPRLWMGAPVWGQASLAERLYPRGAKGAAALTAYARHFDAIELNTTFYGASPEQLGRWASAVPDRFRFAPKVRGAVGHERRLVGAEAESEGFFESLRALGPKRGPAWLLLPPDFGPREAPALTRWIERWSGAGPLAVELRDPRWFADPGATAAAFELFEAHGVATVLSDVALRRDVLHMRLTAPLAIVRFAGHGLHPSDRPRLDQWIERLERWFEGGLREAWLCLHQPDEGLVVELAQHVCDRAAERGGKFGRLELRRPEPLPTYEQSDLFG